MASSFFGSTRRSTRTTLTSEVARRRPSAAKPNTTTERTSSANACCAAAVNSLSVVRTASGNWAETAATSQPGVRLSVETVEPGGVGAGDLEAVFGAGVLEVARDDVLRMRPGRSLVRVIRRPHQLVDADEVPVGDADIVIDVGGPHLTLEILARFQLVRKAGRDALALEGAVHALQIIRQPADIVLGRDDLQFREAVEHAREDQHAERLFDLV